jgi:hypothetical protein
MDEDTVRATLDRPPRNIFETLAVNLPKQWEGSGTVTADEAGQTISVMLILLGLGAVQLTYYIKPQVNGTGTELTIETKVVIPSSSGRQYDRRKKALLKDVSIQLASIVKSVRQMNQQGR